MTQFSDGVGNTLDCAYWASAVGGGSTITASAASINYPTIFAYEFAGVALSSPQDGSTTTAYGSSSSPACTALTPAANGELVISAINFGGTPTPSINSPFTAGFSSSGVYAFGGYYIQPSAGSIAATYGLSSSGGWGCVQAAFKHQ